MKLSIVAFSGLVLCGCAHLATVKTIEPHVPTIAASDEKLALATQKLTAAEREQPLIALATIFRPRSYHSACSNSGRTIRQRKPSTTFPSGEPWKTLNVSTPSVRRDERAFL
jgi:hypothetical protein